MAGAGLLSAVSKVDPGVIKGGVGLATGALQALQAMKLKKKADAAFPELVDPNQASYLADLNQKRKSIETGADFAEGMRAADSTNAATNDAITRNTGGDTGNTIQALLQSQRVAGDTKNQVLAQGQSQQFDYDTAYGQKLDQIAARRLQLQLARSSQARAEWDRKSKLGSANMQAGLASLIGGNKNQTPSATQSLGSGTLPVMDMSSMTGQPASSAMNISTTGVAAPTVVPQQNLATQGLGPVMNLLKK